MRRFILGILACSAFVFNVNAISNSVDLERCYDIDFVSQQNTQYKYQCAGKYYFGKDIDIDYQYAKRYLDMASNEGHARSSHILAIMYLEATGVERSFNKFFEYSLKAVNQITSKEDDYLFYTLGVAYLDGVGTEVDIGKAIVNFTKAKDHEEVAHEARLALCQIYYNNVKTGMNLDEAIYWCQEALKVGSQDAIILLGRIAKEQNLKDNPRYKLKH